MRNTSLLAAETAEEIARAFRQSRHVSRRHALVLGAARRRSRPNSAATLGRSWLSVAPQALEVMSPRVESGACHLRRSERMAPSAQASRVRAQIGDCVSGAVHRVLLGRTAKPAAGLSRSASALALGACGVCNLRGGIAA